MFPDEPAATAFDEAPCGLLHLDRNSVVLRANRTFMEWTGLEQEVAGRLFHEQLDTGSQVLYTTRFVDELWATGELRAVSFRLRRADGSILPILVNARLVTAAVGPAGIRLAIFDATSRDGFERVMVSSRQLAELSESSVRVVQQAATALLGADDDAEVAQILADAARTAFAASDTAVVIYEDGGRTFRTLTGEHLLPLLGAVRETRGPDAVALPSGDMVAITDLDDAYERSPDVGDLLRAARGAAFSGVSIPDGAEVVGAYACLFGRPRTFDTMDIDLHHALAKQAGLAFARVRLQARLRAQASLDPLTGVYNRGAIDAHAESALSDARAKSEATAIIFLDIDGFKQINDGLGHGEGDRVLQEVSARIRGAVRVEDIVGRFGGDEFLVVCRGADEEAAVGVASRIASAIREPLEGQALAGVTASIGIATYTPGGSADLSVDTLTRRADAAMYLSKRAGRDRITVDRT